MSLKDRITRTQWMVKALLVAVIFLGIAVFCLAHAVAGMAQW